VNEKMIARAETRVPLCRTHDYSNKTLPGLAPNHLYREYRPHLARAPDFCRIPGWTVLPVQDDSRRGRLHALRFEFPSTDPRPIEGGAAQFEARGRLDGARILRGSRVRGDIRGATSCCFWRPDMHVVWRATMPQKGKFQGGTRRAVAHRPTVGVADGPDEPGASCAIMRHHERSRCFPNMCASGIFFINTLRWNNGLKTLP